MVEKKRIKEKLTRTLKISDNTYKRLEDYRIADGETFNSIIKRALDVKDSIKEEKKR